MRKFKVKHKLTLIYTRITHNNFRSLVTELYYYKEQKQYSTAGWTTDIAVVYYYTIVCILYTPYTLSKYLSELPLSNKWVGLWSIHLQSKCTTVWYDLKRKVGSSTDF